MSASDPSGRSAITRRRLLLGCGAGLGGLAGLGLGRYAVGEQFEQHVAGVLGVSTEIATVLLAGARQRLGPDYRVHAASFLVATTFPGEQLLPESTRHRAVERFVGNLFGGHVDFLLALGLQKRVNGPCRGLLRA